MKDPSPEKQSIWQSKQQEYKDVVIRKSENKRLFQKQTAYGDGEKVRKMLAHLVRTNSSPSMVPAIRTVRGEISSQVEEITDTFREYYEGLYKSRGAEGGEELDSFFGNIEIPSLTEVDKEEMEAPITLEEIKLAVAEMANQKSPGLDGIPMETYKYYGKVLLLELLKVFNWAKEEGKLPVSMTEATIIVLHKEGKDPLETKSYRPISLLCTDAKIVAKILAVRLNKTISRLVHPDQTGFIPGR